MKIEALGVRGRLKRYSATAHLASALFLGRDLRRCYIAVYDAFYDAFYDTAGSEADEHMVVTVGVVASVEKWRRFEARWTATLARFGVEALHMKEFAHFKGQYATPGWRDEKRRAEFLSALLHDAKRGVNKAFISAVALRDYRTLDADYCLTETIGGAYSLAQAVCLIRTHEWLGEKKHPNTDLVRHLIEFGDTGQRAFLKFVREQVGKDVAVGAITKTSPDGKSLPQFQVADLIAYEHRRLYEHVAKKGVRPAEENWRRSLREIRRLIPFDGSVHYGDSLKPLCEDGTFPPRNQP